MWAISGQDSISGYLSGQQQREGENSLNHSGQRGFLSERLYAYHMQDTMLTLSYILRGKCGRFLELR